MNPKSLFAIPVPPISRFVLEISYVLPRPRRTARFPAGYANPATPACFIGRQWAFPRSFGRGGSFRPIRDAPGGNGSCRFAVAIRKADGPRRACPGGARTDRPARTLHMRRASVGFSPAGPRRRPLGPGPCRDQSSSRRDKPDGDVGETEAIWTVSHHSAGTSPTAMLQESVGFGSRKLGSNSISRMSLQNPLAWLD